MSISIMIEDLRRKPGSKGSGGRDGDGDGATIVPRSTVGEPLGLCTAVDGRAKDHELTRSNANI